jgi:hypothetical protein
MTRAGRVKRGLFRLGLLGIIAAILGALISIVFQFNQPSGKLYSKQVPIQIGSLATKGVTEVRETTEGTNLAELLDGQTGKDYRLIDGRIIRTYYTNPKTQEELRQLNAEIANFEVNNSVPISDYGTTYVASGIAFKCKNYHSCDAPFPISQLSHLDRHMDWFVPFGILVAGAVWFILIWVVSWLIRGFMAE